MFSVISCLQYFERVNHISVTPSVCMRSEQLIDRAPQMAAKDSLRWANAQVFADILLRGLSVYATD